MTRLAHHLENLKQKPHHVRERIALGVSGGVTGLVAIGWLVAMSTSGSFSLATESVANAVKPTEEVSKSLSQKSSDFTNLMGAAAASLGVANEDASVRVVDTKTSSTLEASHTSATVIPF